MVDKFNIAEFALSGAQARSNKTAIQFYRGRSVEREVTYGELEELVATVANALRRDGIGDGSPVVLWLESSLEFVACAFGVLAVGGILVPLSSELSGESVRFVVADIDAAALIGTHPIDGVLNLSAESLVGAPSSPLSIAPTVANSRALVVYTSGTTSHPKGVVHAQRMARGRAPMRAGWTDLRESDVLVHAGKLNWTYAFGLCLIDSLSTGATAVVANDASPADWGEIVLESGATILAGVPSFYRQLTKYSDGEQLRGLRHALCAGESLKPELHERWKNKTGVPIFEALGMSECSTYVSCSPTVPPRPGSAGRPQPGRRIAILPIDIEDGTDPLPTGELGLLAVHRGDPGLMLGYHERPAEDARTTRGEWFCGGDLARMDVDGYVWFEGRNDELMNSFGYRVSPAEVEAVMVTAPGVAAVAVAERRVRSDVSVVCAYVVLASESKATRDSLLAFGAEHLARYKAPREVVFVDALPRNANGKLSRKLLAHEGPR